MKVNVLSWAAALLAAPCLAEVNIPEPDTMTAIPEDAALTRMETRVAPEVWKAWCAAHPAPFRLFGEERRLAVRRDILPAHWFAADSEAAEIFRGYAQPGEFYPFQVCVASDTARELAWQAETDLPVSRITPEKCAVRAHGVKPIWVMVDIPQDAAGKTLRGRVTVTDRKSGETRALPFEIAVKGDVLKDGGVSDGWRLARLKWLNSDIGREETVTKPYLPVAVDAATRTVKVLGRELTLGEDGLPAQIVTHFSGSNTRLVKEGLKLLERPVAFDAAGLGPLGKSTFAFTKVSPVAARWRAETPCGTAKRIVEGSVDYVGKATFTVRFAGGAPAAAVLELRMPGDVARYFEGLGLNGGDFPEKPVTHVWTTKQRRDALWLGRANGGLALRFRDENYRTPFVNIYYRWRTIVLPEGWAAENGTLSVAKENGVAVVRAKGGRAPAGAKWVFDLHISPFRTIDMSTHLRDRYLHIGQGNAQADAAAIRKAGVSIFTAHQNTLWNPYINYPYNDDGGPLLKKLSDELHAQGVTLSAYYTTRELTQNMPEFFALLSLDGEVIAKRDESVLGWPVTNFRGPHSYITNHVGLAVVPAWRETVNFGEHYAPRPDISVLTVPDGRWDNFYLEGLDFLVRRYGLDGLYIDDTALSNESLRRARRILDRDGRRHVIDDHSYSHHCPHSGGSSSNMAFIDLYPYFDLLWRGECFEDDMPAGFWLVERSGAVFGLPGELLGRCDQIRGMLFGATDRLGWLGGRPQGLWKFFDATGLPDADFYGWWDEANPVKVADSSDVKVSTWLCRDGVVLVAANFAKEPRTVTLAGDAKALGRTLAAAPWNVPAIGDVQKQGAPVDLSKPLALPASGGVILLSK